ncbi:Leucine-rich receptor-like kinase family protein [Melia azedarach]|uniref:Leucine-rich receptor-like kinase family protein n=1 Tax=Melia azedarach TaxID=155640 RepID=A0ACC1YD54_MELAZ|nr:Leucine-rich receptor-like kinase family protein [Melia azedarach]
MIESNSLQLLYVLVLLLSAAFGEADRKCIAKEREALLKLKRGLEDDAGYLSSWGSEQDCCQWRGIHCSNRTGHVLLLSLNTFDAEFYFQSLRGNISSSLLELQYLNYLDLSNNDFGGSQIPDFIGSLSKLRFLDLSYANFSGRVPVQLGNLTSLQSLNIGQNDGLLFNKLEWLSHLYNLKHLHLASLKLEEATDWLQVISRLPSLIELEFQNSVLPTINSPSISLVNSSSSLAHLDLSYTNLTNSAYRWLSKIGRNLLTLDLTGNQLQGPIPDYAFWNMTSLMHFNLTSNEITGISKSFGDMCRLKTLRMNNNNLNGQLPDLFFNLSGCAKLSLEILVLDNNVLTGSLPDITKFSSLKELYVSDNKLDGSFPEKFRQRSPLITLQLKRNQLWGSLPDFSVFPLLRILDIRGNRLNGTVSEGLGELSNLESLFLSPNSLQGIITETHMSNLSKLKIMDFSYNSPAFNFSPDWFPPFQLDYIGLRNCKIGPHFPKWLRTQNNYSELDVSNAGILDTIPNWFWHSPSPNLYNLNLSYNQIKGELPDLSLKFTTYPGIDLSSNCLEGPIPPISPNMTSLILFKNNFSGSISFLCEFASERLSYLDLSDNHLSGEIPDCWQNFMVLNLANNNFSGRIPDVMASSCTIRSLHLRNNSLTGELPSSLKNCTELTIIDLGKNKISGRIPAWIGDSLPNLAILSLRSNHITGILPPQLCDLTKVQVLDMSHNNIMGTVPKCLSNLSAMVQTESSNAIITYIFPPSVNSDDVGIGVGYQDQALLVWKGIDSEYRNTLGLVKSIDLSSNKFSGNIPEEITSLFGLISLNLSRNSLTGPIPPKIGQLTMLNSVDLSQNQLTGKIPESFSQMSHLGILNLSNNNLTGKIPTSTQLQSFDTSTYVGNLDLCGQPLPNKCPGEEPDAPPPPPQVPGIPLHESEEDELITRGFYISAVLGFIICFWGIGGTLLLNRKWRNTYFQFLNKVEDKLYVSIAVKMGNLKRRLRS